MLSLAVVGFMLVLFGYGFFMLSLAVVGFMLVLFGSVFYAFFSCSRFYACFIRIWFFMLSLAVVGFMLVFFRSGFVLGENIGSNGN